MSKYIPPHLRTSQAQDKPSNKGYYDTTRAPKTPSASKAHNTSKDPKAPSVISHQKQIKEPVTGLTKSDFPVIGKPVNKTTKKNKWVDVVNKTTKKNKWVDVVNKYLVNEKKEKEKIKEEQREQEQREQELSNKKPEIKDDVLKYNGFVFVPRYRKSKFTLEQELDPYDEEYQSFVNYDEKIDGVVNKCLVNEKKEKEKIKEEQREQELSNEKPEIKDDGLKYNGFVFVPRYRKSKFTLEQELDPYDEEYQSFVNYDEKIDGEIYTNEQFNDEEY
jgi:hypothetical protein